MFQELVGRSIKENHELYLSGELMYDETFKAVRSIAEHGFIDVDLMANLNKLHGLRILTFEDITLGRLPVFSDVHLGEWIIFLATHNTSTKVDPKDYLKVPTHGVAIAKDYPWSSVRGLTPIEKDTKWRKFEPCDVIGFVGKPYRINPYNKPMDLEIESIKTSWFKDSLIYPSSAIANTVDASSVIDVNNEEEYILSGRLNSLILFLAYLKYTVPKVQINLYLAKDIVLLDPDLENKVEDRCCIAVLKFNKSVKNRSIINKLLKRKDITKNINEDFINAIEYDKKESTDDLIEYIRDKAGFSFLKFTNKSYDKKSLITEFNKLVKFKLNIFSSIC